MEWKSTSHLIKFNELTELKKPLQFIRSECTNINNKIENCECKQNECFSLSRTQNMIQCTENNNDIAVKKIDLESFQHKSR